MLVDPAHPEEGTWTDVLPERPQPLQGAVTAGGKLFAAYLADVTTRVYVHGLDGTLENEVLLPGPGSAAGFAGSHDDTFVFYTFNSLSVPPTIYRYDIASRTSDVFRRSHVPGYDPEAFVTTQVFYPSKDGTRIPMFLVHRKDLVARRRTIRRCSTVTAASTSSSRRRSAPRGSRSSSAESCSRRRTCAAAASMASHGTSRA